MDEPEITCEMKMEINWMIPSPSKHTDIIRKHAEAKLRYASMNYMRKNGKKILKEILKEVN